MQLRLTGRSVCAQLPTFLGLETVCWVGYVNRRIQVLSQLEILGLTESGQWAEQGCGEPRERDLQSVHGLEHAPLGSDVNGIALSAQSGVERLEPTGIMDELSGRWAVRVIMRISASRASSNKL